MIQRLPAELSEALGDLFVACDAHKAASDELIAEHFRFPARLEEAGAALEKAHLNVARAGSELARVARSLGYGSPAEPAEQPDEDDDSDPEDRCSNPGGHEYECTGTAYGGDDERWHGEGRCLCIHCGADGDG